MKIVVVVFASILMLTLGQSFAGAAINKSRISAETEAGIYYTEEFSVDIYYVGTSDIDEVTIDTDGTYHIVSEDALTLVNLKLNITGFTCWGPCATNMSDPAVNVTAGELFLIVNGEVAVAGSGALTSGGFDVALPQGYHFVTYMYVGEDETGGFEWAADTIAVRIQKSGTTFAARDTVTVPAEFTFTDVVDTDSQINVSAVYDDPSGYVGGYTKTIDKLFPGGELTFKHGANDVDNHLFEDELSDTTKLTIGGTVNSTGFADYQWLWNATLFDATEGQIFFIDAAGVHDVGVLPTEITMFEEGATFVGLLVLAEYGRWCRGAPGGQAVIPDWDGFLSMTNHTNSSDTISFDGSFDFLGGIEGRWLGFEATRPDIVTTTDVTSEPGTTITSTTTKEEPGFGALVSLLALGIIAFAIPRFRKEKL